jgi:hypothetical protein
MLPPSQDEAPGTMVDTSLDKWSTRDVAILLGNIIGTRRLRLQSRKWRWWDGGAWLVGVGRRGRFTVRWYRYDCRLRRIGGGVYVLRREGLLKLFLHAHEFAHDFGNVMGDRAGGEVILAIWPIGA